MTTEPPPPEAPPLAPLDRALLVLFLMLVAWPDHWVRTAFVLLVGAAEAAAGDRELEFRGHRIRVWERRAVAAFAVLMALSKLVWWSLLCGAVCVGIRQAALRCLQLRSSEPPPPPPPA